MVRIAIHGGAGILSRRAFNQNEIDEYLDNLNNILIQAYKSLDEKKSAVEVVTMAVRALEDCPLFNAGRGSVLDAKGEISMDAAVMCGATLKAGGVTDCRKIRNPVLAAKWVMENTSHPLITGRELETILEKKGLQTEESNYFVTEFRFQQFLKAQKSGQMILDHWVDESNTVGAVALDSFGNVAAATSTGGMTGKFPGRVSDSSVVGAGNYANNETCAVSGTGTGDVFLQMSFCYDIHAQILFGKKTLQEACEHSLKRLGALGGIGGLIALNKNGDLVTSFNSEGMFYGTQKELDSPTVNVFN